ncbi:MAG: glycosyltransferase family 4 protein [Chloroflexota bacterium]|nr:glycosyltransferase family 4 protein [Chloroflexota bacterium]
MDRLQKRPHILLASPDASLEMANQSPVGMPIAPDQVEAVLNGLGYQVEWWSPPAAGVNQVLKNVRLLRHYLRTADTDLLHLFLLNPSLAWISGLLVRAGSAPVLTTFSTQCHEGFNWLLHNGSLDAMSWYMFKYVAYHPLWARLSARMPNSAAFSVASQFQIDQLKHLGFPADRLHVVPNTTDITPNAMPAQRDSRRFRIGFMGHFTPSKGVDLLLEAFEQVAGELDSSELMLAWSGRGDSGAVRQAIQRSRYADCIRLWGRVDRVQFLRGLDLLVQPYRHLVGTQLFPNTLLEAVTVGVPLVTSDIRPLDELPGGEAASLVRPGDPAAVAQAILALADDPAARLRQLANQQKVARRCSPTVVAAAFHQIYQQLLTRRR